MRFWNSTTDMRSSSFSHSLMLLAIGLTVRPASSAEPADSKALAARVQHSDKVPADTSPWGSLQWLMNAKIEPGAGLTLGVVAQIAARQ